MLFIHISNSNVLMDSKPQTSMINFTSYIGDYLIPKVVNLLSTMI